MTAYELGYELGLVKASKYDGRKHPSVAALKKGRTKLMPEERQKVIDADATWHDGLKGKKTPAVWKSMVNGKTWYATNTHRALNAASTLKGAISRYHKFIKSTA